MRVHQLIYQLIDNPEFQKEYTKLGPLGDVASELLRIRCERGLTILALAELTGVSRNTLSQMENMTGNPTMSTLHRIAQATGRVLRIRLEKP